MGAPAPHWTNPFDPPAASAPRRSRWHDAHKIASDYADWVVREGHEPAARDWERKDPERRRPTYQGIYRGRSGLTWEGLRAAGRDELRPRGRDDLIDG